MRQPRREAHHLGGVADPERGGGADAARLRADRGVGLLPTMSAILVTIVGAPVSCGGEVKDTWRELTEWTAAQLRHRYGAAVAVEYHDLFDPAGPALPHDAKLPLVIVDGQVLSSGGKISLPRIRRALEAVGVAPDVPAIPST